MASFCGGAAKTPTKTPTKVVQRKNTTRSCVVCNRDLVTYTKYSSLNNENYGKRIANIVQESEHTSNYICGPCMTQLKKLERYATDREILELDFRAKYNATRDTSKLVRSSPVHVRTKRMSVESPPAKSSAKARRSLGLDRSDATTPVPSSGRQISSASTSSSLADGIQSLQITHVSEYKSILTTISMIKSQSCLTY